MNMVTFLPVFCLIICAHALHGVEMDQVVGEAVKATSAQPQARAKEIDTLFVTHLEAKAMDTAPQLEGKMDQVTSIDGGMQLQAKAKKRGIVAVGHDPSVTSKYEKLTWKGIKVTRFRNLKPEECRDDLPCEEHVDCTSHGCDYCDDIIFGGFCGECPDDLPCMSHGECTSQGCDFCDDIINGGFCDIDSYTT